MSDPPEFGDLFLRHAPRIHRYIARRTDSVVADDVLNETFLVAFEKRESFDQTIDTALPWLFGIATNILHRHRTAEARTLKFLERTLVREGSDEETQQCDAQLDAQLRVHELAGKLRSLKKGDRDVLLLFAWEDLSYEQIGHALNIPTGTVRSRLNRARRILRDAADSKEGNRERFQVA